MYKNYLFDLDGTLLPMDMEGFTKLYFGSISKRFSPVLNIDAEAIINAIWAGTKAMYKNNGDKLNKDVFWETFSAVTNIDSTEYIEQFDDYYLNEFICAKQATFPTDFAKKSIDFIKQNGGKIICATNPIFPKVGTYRRLEWAGLNPEDFELITVYENCKSCKPNLNYYQSICEACNIKPEESIMIGNDIDEDLCSAKLGFDTYLITDTLVNRENKDYSEYKNGTWEEFYNSLIDGKI